MQNKFRKINVMMLFAILIPNLSFSQRATLKKSECSVAKGVLYIFSISMNKRVLKPKIQHFQKKSYLPREEESDYAKIDDYKIVLLDRNNKELYVKNFGFLSEAEYLRNRNLNISLPASEDNLLARFATDLSVRPVKYILKDRKGAFLSEGSLCTANDSTCVYDRCGKGVKSRPLPKLLQDQN